MVARVKVMIRKLMRVTMTATVKMLLSLWG